MLKRLQHRFIRIAMGSLLAVFLFLLIAINWINSWSFREGADAMLRLIAENDGRLPDYVQITAGEFQPEPSVRFTAETPFFTRFFVVHGSGGQVSDVQMEKIAAVTGEDAEQYYRDAVNSGREYGFCGEYRYLVTEEGGQSLVVFLDCSRDLQAVRSFLGISAAVAAVAYGAVFLLVSLLSRRAIRPMLRSIEQQKQFITDAGHELKTPLTIISTSADVLDAELPGNEWLQNIRRQAERMTGLVGHLITLSRMDEETGPLRRDPFVLSEAVWDVTMQFRPLAEACGKRLCPDIQDDILFRGDTAAIWQMLSLLLDNAVRYADDGSAIRLRLRQERSIVLEIENDCTLPEGLDPERLFDRFYRLDPARARNSGGSGIGLAVARAIAVRHGGMLRAVTGDGLIRFIAVF